MATTYKPFRELVSSNSNFEFVGRTRIWVMLSAVLIIGSIAMLFVNKEVRGDYLNWTIDFKGGTEMIWEFRDAKTNEHVRRTTNGVRKALKDGGFGSIEVSDFTWTGTDGKTVYGMLTRTANFGALQAKRAAELKAAFAAKFKDRDILSARWSGDRLFVRTKKGISEEEGIAFFDKYEKGWMKPWGTEKDRFSTAAEGTGEYNMQFGLWGLDRQFEAALEKGLAGTDAGLIQAYGVGAKAGHRLKNDGIKSLFYAMALIVLYLAFRFDVRYCPGAIIALMHDAILVMGVFAVTYTDVSLTSVAALLTVIGYSVNDTVVIFDRIRENVGRLKDKKLPRIVNISLNETLARTLLTSITLFVVTIAMNIFGTGVVRNFAFAMNIGVVVGVYSSIFIASPVFLWVDARFYPARAGGGTRSGGKSKKSSARATAATVKPAKEAEPEVIDEGGDDGEDEVKASGSRKSSSSTKRRRKGGKKRRR